MALILPLLTKFAKPLAGLAAAIAVGVGGAELYEHSFDLKLGPVHLEALGPKLKDAQAALRDPKTNQLWSSEYQVAQKNYETAQANEAVLNQAVDKQNAAINAQAQASLAKTAKTQKAVDKGNTAMIKATAQSKLILKPVADGDFCSRIITIDKQFLETLK